MSKVSEMDSSKVRLSCLLYGASGTKKTRSLLTVPPALNVKIVDFDNGAFFLKGKEGMKVLTFVDGPAIPKGYKGPTEKRPLAWQRGRDEIISTLLRPGDTDLLVVDTITTISNAIIRAKLEEKGDPFAQPTLQEWGAVIRELTSVFSMCLDPRIHVIVIAHEEVMLSKEGGIDGYRPLVNGRQLPAQMPNFFDEVYRSVERGNNFMWQVSTHDHALAKTRLGMGFTSPGVVVEETGQPKVEKFIPQSWAKVFKRLKEEFNGAVP